MKPILISVACVIAVLAVIGLAVAYKGSSDKFYGRKVSLDTATEMTVRQRTEDFGLICSQLEDNMPMLYDYEELYGISYAETKAYYEKQAAQAGDDFEYYTAAKGFLNNIPSAHLSVGFPLMESIDDDFAAELGKKQVIRNGSGALVRCPASKVSGAL